MERRYRACSMSWYSPRSDLSVFGEKERDLLLDTKNIPTIIKHKTSQIEPNTFLPILLRSTRLNLILRRVAEFSSDLPHVQKSFSTLGEREERGGRYGITEAKADLNRLEDSPVRWNRVWETDRATRLDRMGSPAKWMRRGAIYIYI